LDEDRNGGRTATIGWYCRAGVADKKQAVNWRRLKVGELGIGESGRGGAGALLTQHCLEQAQEQFAAASWGMPLLARL